LYFSIAAGTGYLFVRFRINRATREIKVQAQIEKARSQEREAFRKKSAADFHDEAGNKITKINLFSEMARREMHNKEQLENFLKKIQLNATELSAGMRDFLWVLDPQQDSLFGTISRLKDFGDSNLTETGVRFTLNGMNSDLPEIALPMNTRRDILQIFKEVINNCAKHAEAKEAVLSIWVVNQSIFISLTDDGKGFDPSSGHLKNKYGLSIMRERAYKISAELEIASQINKGTSITLKCKIPHLGNSF
jgi:signal transduction histidine kinase